MWQEALTVLMVAAAVFYLVRRFVTGAREPGGCEKCVGKAKGKISEKT